MSVPEGCPMHQEQKKPESGCPVNHQKEKPQKPMPQPSQIPSGCPMHNSAQVNQDNMMPQLTQTKQPDQTIDLPTERVISSIPKSKDSEAKWEYPSPQQFYNALRRKGWETPEDEIETMVDIHNFLNEEAWQEVLKWEKKYKWIHTCQNSKTRRYVIDYYEAPEDVPGVPVFHLDIRPALDDVDSIMVRFKEAAKAKWEQWFSS
ncbi:cytochrome c and c1 heme-lyase [Rhizopus microsporus var. microsporus]|uniref:Holocytochrome c-type synthase n=1 Tax=Rhizopus microsporus var. microsporus TaxID=86635 RepID=A0A1X0QN92_RHIZD|nr:cytochrome c and c1 heme-lyase [Rhizopus microsporus var. microsporus]